jgi:DNA primase
MEYLDKKTIEFKREKLIPVLVEQYLDKAFPAMEFKLRGNWWKSKYHINGERSTDGKEQTTINKNGKTLRDWNGEKQYVFDFAMQQYGLNERDTIERLAGICGLPLPEKDPEFEKRWAARNAKRDALNASWERQQAALFTPEGKAVLDYLHNERGYDDELIKTMELGYLSPEEAATLYDLGEFGPKADDASKWKKKNYPKDFPLSIPYKSDGKLCGFEFRYVTEEAKQKHGKGKYRKTDSLKEKTHALPFLFDVQAIKARGKAVIVEGELDALHAYAKGIKNVVASSGQGGISETALALIAENAKFVTFIPDNDKQSEEDIKNGKEAEGVKAVKNGIALAKAEELHLRSFVTKLPDAYKDVDEYLREHTGEKLAYLLENTDTSTGVEIGNVYADWWKYQLVLDAARTKYEENPDSPIYNEQLKDDVCDIANECNLDDVREGILADFGEHFPNIKGYMKERADRLREEAAKQAAAETAKQAAKEYANLVAQGKIDEANEFMEASLAEQKKKSNADRFADLWHLPTWEEFKAAFRNKPEALETSYKFEFAVNGEKIETDEVPLTIPSGALTIIAAPTSHGKSTFLQNLALDIAKRYTEKDILYFTFEECMEDVQAQLTNTYLDVQLHKESKRHNQLDTIANYLKTGSTQYMKAEVADTFVHGAEDFFTRYLASGKIHVWYKDYSLETLVDALEAATERYPTTAIFIDYIQILKSDKFARQPRNEQLKNVCIALKDFSVKKRLPVVLAAQLTREAATPLRMDNTLISESSDIEKAANTIVCLWNSQFKTGIAGEKKANSDEIKELNVLGSKDFVLGQEGKLFAKLTKRRGGRGVGKFAIWDYKGYSKKVVENFDPSTPEPEEPEYTEV